MKNSKVIIKNERDLASFNFLEQIFDLIFHTINLYKEEINPKSQIYIYRYKRNKKRIRSAN